jgi:hypothetical protein
MKATIPGTHGRKRSRALDLNKKKNFYHLFQKKNPRTNDEMKFEILY